MTKQPEWEFVVNLGDVNIADHGGFLVFRDKTGVYDAEAEIYQPNDENEGTGGEMRRIMLEPPRFKTNGPFDEATGEYRMVWHKEWFVEKVPEVAASCGTTATALIRLLASRDVRKRAAGYQMLVGYFGAHEFDQYAIRLTEDEAQARYKEYR